VSATRRPRVGISRCLLGDEVRYDGTHKREPVLIDTLGRYVEWVSVCPEVEMGMGTPREPIHLVASPDGVASAAARVRLIGVSSGRDWTAVMAEWRRARLRELADARLSGYVLKAGSPSCGLDVPVEGAGISGRGLFAQSLLEAFPELPVEEESRLRDAALRASFLDRVHARHRARCEQDP
jgi:uncharacterized protein YbbK (DUF523 family)